MLPDSNVVFLWGVGVCMLGDSFPCSHNSAYFASRGTNCSFFQTVFLRMIVLRTALGDRDSVFL